MSYSVDLRTRVIEYIENGGSILSATRIYKVGRSTIYRWLARVDLKPTCNGTEFLPLLHTRSLIQPGLLFWLETGL
ncbi:MAG: helix-turn-helix domain-containing protein [Okeania sp. SIO2C2]|nr:helix-turn-helix domain-containing protein [Okeania sp. SIO2C2]